MNLCQKILFNMRTKLDRIISKNKKKQHDINIIKYGWYPCVGHIKEIPKGSYIVPTSKSNNKKDYKRISRKVLRNMTKRDLRKDPDEIGNEKGSEENKKFDYWWTID